MRRTPDRLEEDRLLQDSARRYLQTDLAWSLARKTPDRAQLADLGWFLMGLDEDLGGLGNDLHQSLLVLLESGHVQIATDLAADLLLAPRVISRLGDAALAEDLGAGTARFGYAPAARGPGGMCRTGDGRIEGRSLATVDLELADHIILALPGVVALAPASGLELSACRMIDGRRGATARLNGTLPAGTRVLAEGDAADRLKSEYDDLMAIGTAADVLGAFEAGFETTIEYLKTRRQFGQPLSAFQAVQQHMANAYAAQEGFRSLCLVAASAPDAPTRRLLAARLAIQLRRKLLPAAGLCIQVTGGIGVTEEFLVSHVYRRLQAASALWLRDSLLDGQYPTPTASADERTPARETVSA